MGIRYVLVDSDIKYTRALKHLWDNEGGLFPLDIETGNINEGLTGLDIVSSTISLIQILVDNVIYLFDKIALEDTEDLFEFIASRNNTFLIHNARFELGTFMSQGRTIGDVYCTLIADKVLTAGKSNYKYSLAEVVLRRLGKKMDKEEQKSDWLQRPLTERQKRYACIDVIYLPKLYALQQKESAEQSLDHVINLEMDCLKVFTKMSVEGLIVDSRRLEEAQRKFKTLVDTQLAELQQKLPKVPLPKSAWNKPKKDGTQTLSKRFRMFPSGYKPIQGPADIKNALKVAGYELPEVLRYSKTTQSYVKTECFDSKHRMLVNHPDIALIDDFCENSSFWTKYLSKADAWKHPITSRLHYEIDQVKNTGRISVSNPPIQQIPSSLRGFISAQDWMDTDPSKVTAFAVKVYRKTSNAKS